MVGPNMDGFFLTQVISGCEVTVGQSEEGNAMWPYAGTAAAVEQMGAKHINKNVDISF